MISPSLHCYTLGLVGAFVLNYANSQECPDNIKTCYNCDVGGGGCSSTVLPGQTEEECLNNLAISSVWNIVYDSLTGDCNLNECKQIFFIYKKGSVVHRKTCDTECGDFTLMMTFGHSVSPSINSSVYFDFDLPDCLSACLETNSSCTVMHEEKSETCWLYTSCEDSCEINSEHNPDVKVFKRQCEPEGTFNAAFNKSTSMSSLWTDWGEPYIFRSPLGADGNTNQDKYAASCFVTDGQVSPWWRVDLGATFRIHRVLIYNRLDCCSERAHDLVLSVGLTVSDLVVQDYLPLLHSTFPFTLPSDTAARYVQLEINATYLEYFHLCEVQVFGIQDCGNLVNPVDGFVFTTDTTLNEYAEYTCNTGYILSGNSSRRCQIDHMWSRTDPACNPVDCGPLSSPPNGSVTASGLTYLNIATYICLSGFYLTGSATRACGSDGNWDGLEPFCNPVDCGPLTSPLHGNVNVSGITFGHEATYSCEVGFSIFGNSVTVCEENGSWDVSSPVCNPVDCGNLTNPVNGMVTYINTTYLHQATYSCVTGYNLTDESTRVCQANGNWDGSVPLCDIVDCGPLSSPPNGSVNVSGTTFQSVASYRCVLTYTLSTNNVRVCLANGSWEGVTPVCELVQCENLSNPQNGTVTMPTKIIYGSQASYGCHEGFFMVGNSSSSCQLNGSWDSMAPTCEPVDCGNLTDPLHGSVNTSGGTTLGKHAQYSCNNGYVIIGNNTSTCTSNGTWSNGHAECLLQNTSVTASSASIMMTSTLAVTQTFSTSTSSPAKIYIMPCICYHNKTFVNMTTEEIIAQLVADTKIDTKITTLSISKLNCRTDGRTSSKVIGLIGAATLTSAFGLLVFSDAFALISKMISLVRLLGTKGKLEPRSIY